MRAAQVAFVNTEFKRTVRSMEIELKLLWSGIVLYVLGGSVAVAGVALTRSEGQNPEQIGLYALWYVREKLCFL